MQIINMQSTSGIHLVFLILSGLVLLFGIAYQPLPEEFPQPWKYRLLSYWAQRIDQIVRKEIRNDFHFQNIPSRVHCVNHSIGLLVLN